MIAPEVQQEIIRRLRNIEESEDVRILLAVESGSRAWGFASPDSDYDVRFIYTRKRDWYVCVDLEEKRDVLEYGIVDDIDANGWDLRKSLRLLGKSNPVFIEWIKSPIVYIQSGVFKDRVLSYLSEIYNVNKGIYHYRSMAKTNYRGYLQADKVPLKKYFYVLRPLLAVRWLERFKEAAPIEFNTLLTMIDDQSDLRRAIDDLIQIKKRSAEVALGEPIPILNFFIEEELERLNVFQTDQVQQLDKVNLLNEIFYTVLSENN